VGKGGDRGLKSKTLVLVFVLVIVAAVPIGIVVYERYRALTTKQTVLKSLIYDEGTRTYYERVPLSYNGSSPVALVIMLHGAGSDGQAYEMATNWSTLAETYNFIIVYPNSEKLVKYGGQAWWNAYDWNESSFPDDHGFLMALIDKLKSDYNIDDSRVFMTGHSNGASMAISFALKYTKVLAAIAPASSAWMTGDPMYDIDPQSVPQPNAPIPVYMWRGEVETWPDADEDQLHLQYWLDWNHASKTPRTVTDGIYTTEIYTGGYAEVRYTTIENRGHNTYDSQTAKKIWGDFFSRISREPSA